MNSRLIPPSSLLWAPRPQCRRLLPEYLARPFSTTCSLSDNSDVNHYDILQVKPDVSPSELKKQFYTLSRSTHPDMNPNDPNASERFSQVSASYSVLADPEKRKRYDRDVFRTRQASSGPRAAGHKGSYAGSRPPSGLSKRRGTFRGPPPSFYAHGGAKAGNSSQASNSGQEPQAGSFDPSSYSSNYDPDFDPDPVYRTQSVEDNRRNTRRQAEMARAQAELDDDGNFWGRVVIITGVIVGAISLGSVIAGAGGTKGGMTRGDGSKRNGPKNEWTKG